jgi:hypothetical protein
MGELGGIVHYLYWSAGRVDQVITDNGFPIKRPVSRTIGGQVSTPVGGVTYANTTMAAVVPRHRIALDVEKGLGSSAVSSFDGPGPIGFAKGIGTIVFGEFVNTGGDKLGIGSVFATSESTDGGRTAICLFGSMSNFTDYLQEGGSRRQEGWTSSSAPYIRDFLNKNCKGGVAGLSETDLASAALDVCLMQGTYVQAVDGDERRASLPWRRGFNYGDVQNVAEWCAQIHYDARIDVVSEYRSNWKGFHRVLIGAPLWVRTPTLRAIRLYQEYDPRDLDSQAGFGRIDSTEDSTPADLDDPEPDTQPPRDSHDARGQSWAWRDLFARRRRV